MSELRTNRIVPRDGMPSAAYGGGIIQVVYHQYSTDISFNTNTEITTATIKPSSASNKILIDVRIRYKHEGTNGQYFMRLDRKIGSGSYSTGINGSFAMHSSSYGTAGHMFQPPWVRMYNDNPGTTDVVTYKIQINPWGSPGSNFRLNPFDGDQENQGLQMIMYEVSA